MLHKEECKCKHVIFGVTNRFVYPKKHQLVSTIFFSFPSSRASASVPSYFSVGSFVVPFALPLLSPLELWLSSLFTILFTFIKTEAVRLLSRTVQSPNPVC